MAKIQVSQPAPVFEVDSQKGKIRLADYKDKKNVVLCFYCGDDTPGCNIQLSRMLDDYSKFAEKDTEILGVNPASIEKHDGYATKFKFPFPLLADIDKTICESYGVLRMFIRSVIRTVVIIDKQGIIRYIQRGMPADDELLRILDEINK